jgi:hypothetical protein
MLDLGSAHSIFLLEATMQHPHITTPTGVSITTTSGEILAHHTTDHPFSHYGTAIWCIEDKHPAPGPVMIVNSGTGQEIPLQLLGIVGGWAVLADEAGAALGVIWSDGSYEAGLIRERDTGEIAKGITLESVLSGEYMVEGAVLLPGAVLGCAI